MLALMRRCSLVLSDPGGLQEGVTAPIIVCARIRGGREGVAVLGVRGVPSLEGGRSSPGSVGLAPPSSLK